MGVPVTIMIACEKPPMNGQPHHYDRPVLGNLNEKGKKLDAYLLPPFRHGRQMSASLIGRSDQPEAQHP